MNILYEEDGGVKAASVLADNDSSLQVETTSGRRIKVKASSVLLRFREPNPGTAMSQAQHLCGELDLGFLWEVSGQDEFGFEELARDYFGHEPGAAEAAAILMRLYDAPMYFYKKGRGRFKPAPADALQAALAGLERKRLQAEQQRAYVAELSRFELPEAFRPLVYRLLFKPDRNSVEFKALEEASRATGLKPARLLEKCGGIPSPYDYHFQAFLSEHFPLGTGFAAVGPMPPLPELPVAAVEAFSIDDASTTEIDDAFSVRRGPDGTIEVGVHIAAPALSAPPASRLDEIALNRLSTVYLPGDKIPMLPEELIRCHSLNQGAVVPVISLYLSVNPEDFAVTATATRLERVRIADNLRIEALEPRFNEGTVGRPGPDYPYRAELETLWHLANRLEADRGCPENFGNLDYRFVIEGDRVRIEPRPRGTPVDKLVSELMIFANATWGKWLAERRVTAIYRSQTGGKVRMSTVPDKHAGLGVEQYIWASSPLRRYVDLLNQRQLLAAAAGEQPPYGANNPTLLGAISAFEMAYDAYRIFQRNMERYWCLRYLLQEGISLATATVIRDGLVRFDTLPLVVRVASMPHLSSGSQVLLALSEIDLFENELHCEYQETLAGPESG